MSMLFWFLVACMLFGALVFTLLPLLRPQTPAGINTRREMNINLRKEQLTELQLDYDQGLIDENEFKQAKKELEVGLLSDIDEVTEQNPDHSSGTRNTVLILAVLLPVFAIATYFTLGSPQMLDVESLETANPDSISIEKMMQQLAERLESDPDDAEGWIMLARSYMVTEQPEKAAEAYGNAFRIIGDDPALLADYAEARIVADRFQVNEESDKLIRRALSLNPEEPKVLWVAGFAELAQGNGERTLELWNTLLAKLEPESEEWLSLKDKIERIQAAMANPVPGNAAAGEQSSQDKSIRVSVSLEAGLKSMVQQDQTVYVYARASSGPRMPLAVAKMKAGDLPFEITLDDSLAMSPELSLSAFDEVIVTARVSMSGEAIPSSGDLSGNSAKLKLGEVRAITVNINQILP